MLPRASEEETAPTIAVAVLLTLLRAVQSQSERDK